LKWSLTSEHLWNLFLKQERKCALSGVEIYFSKRCKPTKDDPQTASLDRIDSSKGYIRGNVQWVHKYVNNMKMSLSEETLLDYCAKIYKYKRKK
jgi:hypothetical protein